MTAATRNSDNCASAIQKKLHLKAPHFGYADYGVEWVSESIEGAYNEHAALLGIGIYTCSGEVRTAVLCTHKIHGRLKHSMQSACTKPQRFTFTLLMCIVTGHH